MSDLSGQFSLKNKKLFSIGIFQSYWFLLDILNCSFNSAPCKIDPLVNQIIHFLLGSHINSTRVTLLSGVERKYFIFIGIFRVLAKIYSIFNLRVRLDMVTNPNNSLSVDRVKLSEKLQSISPKQRLLIPEEFSQLAMSYLHKIILN